MTTCCIKHSPRKGLFYFKQIGLNFSIIEICKEYLKADCQNLLNALSIAVAVG